MNGSRNFYKRFTTGLCHYCDYSYLCKKGHACGYYKISVKSKLYKKRKRIKKIYLEE